MVVGHRFFLTDININTNRHGWILSLSFIETTGMHQVCSRKGGYMGLQKWSTNTDTQLAPTWEVCGASDRDMLVHWAGWPVGVSEDLRAKLHVLGETEAAWGSRSSTARENFRPWGPHITSGLSKVSPATTKSNNLKHSTIWRRWLKCHDLQINRGILISGHTSAPWNSR